MEAELDQLFDKLVSLYRMVSPSQEGEAELFISDNSVVSLLNELLDQENYEYAGILILEGDPNQLSIGQTIKLQFQQPLVGGPLLQNIEELVIAGQLKEPGNYYIWNTSYARGDPNEPKEISDYKKVLELISLLRKSSSYFDESLREFVFVQSGFFNLRVCYSLDDVLKSSGSIEKLLSFFDNKHHLDQKLSMLVTAIQNIAIREEDSKRFVLLLHNLDKVSCEVEKSYRIFCADFSYEKIKNDIQDAHIEFTSKIHKTFSDIQNQLLAIPVATVVLATQMKRPSDASDQNWINSFLLLSSFIFTFFFGMLVYNQKHTLEVILEEISRRKSTIAKDHFGIVDLLAETFDKLCKRVRGQIILLFLLLGIIIMCFVFTAKFYFHILYLH